jgi:hypothetical protein
MRWRRIAWTSSLFAVLAGTGLGVSLWLASPPPAQAPPPFPSRVATEIEQRAIVQAVRADLVAGAADGREAPEVDDALLWFCPGGRRPSVTDDCGAMTSGASEIIASTSFDLDFDARPGIPRDFRLALIDANLVPGTLSSRDPVAMARERRVSSKSGGDGPGVVHVTRPVVSQDGGQSLLYGVYRLSPEFAVGVLFHLARADGQWRVQNAFTLWMT